MPREIHIGMTDREIEARVEQLRRLEFQLRYAQQRAGRLGMPNYVEVLTELIEPLARLRARGGRFY